MVKNILLVLYLLFLFTNAIHSQSNINLLDDYLQNQHQVEKFNGNILLADKGTIIYEKSFGLANRSTNEPLTLEHLFDIGSVAKQFTAMAIVMLKEEGKLAYDDPITKFIPEFKKYPKITIRNLLDHSSGIRDYLRLDSLFNPNIYNTNDHLIKVFEDNSIELVFQPNTQHEYSNTNYILLSSIIEKASGMSYEDYLSEYIFKPLEMTDTFVYLSRYKPKKIKNIAMGYVYSDSMQRFIVPDSLPKYKKVIYLDGMYGDGMIYSTLADLFKWDRNLYHTKLVNKESMMEIFTPSPLSEGHYYPYGFGWRIQQHDVYGKIVSHEGSWAGFHAIIERYVDHDKTFIALTNSYSSVLPGVMARRALFNQKMPNEVVVSEETLSKYSGKYKVNEDISINISVSGANLIGQVIGDDQVVTLYPISENVFIRDDLYDIEIEFIKDPSNDLFKMITYENGQIIEEFLRID